MASSDMLLSLPSEVRNLMYDTLFAHNREAIIVNSVAPNTLAPLATCRWFYQEATSYFYSRNHFAFEGIPNQTATSSVFTPTPDRFVGNLKRVSLALRTGHTDQPRVQAAAKRITSLIYTRANFDEINITLRAVEGLSPLMNTWFDDSIMDMDHCIVKAIVRILQAQITKVLRIRLEGAWFAPNVATDIVKSRKTTDGLVFLLTTNDHERALHGRYSFSLFDLFSDDSSSSSNSQTPPDSAIPFDSFPDMDLDSNEEEPDDKEEDLEDEDLDDVDADPEDLLPFDNDDETLANISNIINFVPELLM
jgi:hypothetical protein